MSLGRMFVFSPRRYRALNRADARPGDRVVVAVADGALWRGATAGYLVPLALVLAGAILGARAGGDLVAAAGAGIGLVTGGVWLRLHARRTSAELDDSPVIVRRRENAVLLFKENS
jgi:sigma-E factor negative regulatory protein RseC